MNCTCYICGKIISDEHFFLVKFKGYTRIMCRKCGVRYRRENRKKVKGDKENVKSEGIGKCANN